MNSHLSQVWAKRAQLAAFLGTSASNMFKLELNDYIGILIKRKNKAEIWLNRGTAVYLDPTCLVFFGSFFPTLEGFPMMIALPFLTFDLKTLTKQSI